MRYSNGSFRKDHIRKFPRERAHKQVTQIVPNANEKPAMKAGFGAKPVP
jgi:hypothetical protein